jgi:hypothetical protein
MLKGHLDLFEAGLAEGMAATENPRDLINFIVLEEADGALFFLHI